MLRALLHSHLLLPAQWLLGEGSGFAGLHEDKDTQVPHKVPVTWTGIALSYLVAQDGGEGADFEATASNRKVDGAFLVSNLRPCPSGCARSL